MPPTRGSSTCTSSGCVPRSRRIRSARRSWSRSAASATRRDRADPPARRKDMKGAATSSGAAPSRDRLSALRTRGALRNLRAPVVVPESVVRLRRLARRRLGALRRRLAAAHRVLRARWLRSLQLRVVTTTLLISAVVVTVLGFFLMQQITSDQLRAKEAQASNLVDNGLITAETQQGVTSPPNAATAQNLMGQIVDE